MFVYFVQNTEWIDNYGYRERFHRLYKEYKDAKEYVNNYLETLNENNAVKVSYESEDKDSVKKCYIISYSLDGFHNKTIKERCTITLERLY